MNTHRRIPHAALAVAPILRDHEEVTPPFGRDSTVRAPRPTLPFIVDPEIARLSRRSLHDDDTDDEYASSGFPTPPSRSGLTTVVPRQAESATPRSGAPPAFGGSATSELPTLIPPPVPGESEQSLRIDIDELLAMTPPPPPRPQVQAWRPAPPRYVPAVRPSAFSMAALPPRRPRTGSTSRGTIALMLFASVIFTSVAVTLLVSATGQLKICAAER